MTTTATVKLISERLRLVEVTGPLPPEWRRPKLKVDNYVRDQQLPQTVGLCIKRGRTSRFLIDKSPAGDDLLSRLRSPTVAEPYGEGWVVR